jgi:hypothetical protein
MVSRVCPHSVAMYLVDRSIRLLFASLVKLDDSAASIGGQAIT